VKVLPKPLQEVGVAISSAKIRALCPRAEIDGIAVDLVDGISYAQLARLSVSLGTAEIYVDLVPGDSGSAGRDHLVLTINWDSPGGMDNEKADERKSKPPEALSKGLQQPVLYSPRGIPLVWGSGHPKAGAVLTVECYCKWYELFLVCPDAIVGVDFGVLGMHSKDEAPYCDHAPNPRAVYRYAQARGYLLDNVAFEMIIGRWEIEYHEHYDVEQEDDCLGRRLGGP
jgi:hypothetical protein